MRVVLSAALLGLAWFAAVNLVASASAWVAARVVLRRGIALPGTALLTVRLLPAAAALGFAAAVFGPAHLRFEPAEADERFGLSLFALAALGALLLARSARRALLVASAARTARRLPAVPMGPDTNDAFEAAGFSGISLVGVVRPRILVGAAARRALSPDEFALALAHERAHRRALDNLKRCAIFCAPDVFGGSATAAALEARWRGQAEREADERAVAADERRALHLASALLKVARADGRTGSGAAVLAAPFLWSTFNEPPLLEERVRALLEGTARARPRWRSGAYAVLLAAAALFAAAWLAPTPHSVHALTETLVAALP